MKRAHIILVVAAALVGCLCAGCATTYPAGPQPVTYVAVERPEGVIEATHHRTAQKDFRRGGFYVLNYNFRPAPDISSYLDQTSTEAGADILRSADVKLTVPFAFDILFFGVNFATDTVTAGGI